MRQPEPIVTVAVFDVPFAEGGRVTWVAAPLTTRVIVRGAGPPMAPM